MGSVTSQNKHTVKNCRKKIRESMPAFDF